LINLLHHDKALFMNILPSRKIEKSLLRPGSRRMVFSWFSSSSGATGPETQRGGYECAPYTILETQESYQVRWEVEVEVENRVLY